MRRKHFSGSVTIEATFSLTFFIFGFLVILSLADAVRTESAVQCGINRTATEIARYSYAAEKLSLTDHIQGAGITVGEAIENIGGFSNLAFAGGSENGDAGNTLSEMADTLSGGAKISGIVGDPLIRSVFSGCVAGTREETDEYLRRLSGISADDIDFHYSSVLADGKTVEIVAVYKVKLHTFGLFGKKGISMTMKNTACSSAWVTGSKKVQAEPSEEPSKWTLTSFKRGQAWVAEIKSENRKTAVKSGKGVDLCDGKSYVLVGSVNVFTTTYSDCSEEGSTDVSDYKAKENAILKNIGNYASELKRFVKEKGDSLQYEESGEKVPDIRGNCKLEVIIVVPTEASQSPEMKAALDSVAAKVLEQKGVHVRYEFRENALSAEKN